MQVFEYLAETKILTLENILKPSPHGGERSEIFFEYCTSVVHYKKVIHFNISNYKSF